MIFSISSESESPPNSLLILKYMISNKDRQTNLTIYNFVGVRFH